MRLKKLMSAAVAGMLTITSYAAPAVTYTTTTMVAEAASTKEVDADSLPYTLYADNINNGKRQANFILTGDLKKAKKLVVNMSTTCDENATVAAYGLGTTIAPDYWENIDTEVITEGAGNFTMEIDVPERLQGKINKLGIGIWYPKDSSPFVVKSITADGVADIPDPIEPVTGDTVLPETQNDKSGDCSFVDNGDGTAAVSSTLSAQFETSKGDTTFEYPVKAGKSYKFDLNSFKIDDIENARLQSIEFVAACDDFNMDEINYTGGISIKPQDGSDETWFDDDKEYKAEFCGGYAKFIWDVPENIQPLVDGTGSVSFNYILGKDKSMTGTDDEGSVLEYAPIPELTLCACTATYTRKAVVPYTETVKQTKSTVISKGKNAKFEIKDLDLSRMDQLSAVKFSFNMKSEMQKFIGAFGCSLDEEKTGTTWYTTSNICVINNGPKFDVMWIIPENLRDAVWGGSSANIMAGYWYGDKEGGDVIPSVTIDSIEYYISRFPEDDLVLTNTLGKTAPKKLELIEGKVYSVDANLETAVFESTDTSVATVKNGVIKAVAPGVADIVVTSPMGQEARISITVTPAPVTTTAVTTTAVTTTTTIVTTTAATTSIESSVTSTDAVSVTDPVNTTTAAETTTVTQTETDKITSTDVPAVTTTSAIATTTASSTTSRTTTNAVTTTQAVTTTDAPVQTTTSPIDIDITDLNYGDIDLNGTVELADVTCLAKHLLNPSSNPLGEDPVSAQRAKLQADLNGDGKVDSVDLSKIIEFNLGKLTASALSPKK